MSRTITLPGVGLTDDELQDALDEKVERAYRELHQAVEALPMSTERGAETIFEQTRHVVRLTDAYRDAVASATQFREAHAVVVPDPFAAAA